MSVLNIASGDKHKILRLKQLLKEHVGYIQSPLPLMSHQNRASPFASDFDRRRGCRKEFRSEDHFAYPFSSQKKNRGLLAIFFAEEIAHLRASKSRAIFPGAVKIAAATAENRAILVHSVSCTINVEITALKIAEESCLVS